MRLTTNYKKYSLILGFACLYTWLLGSTFLGQYPFYDNFCSVGWLSKAVVGAAAVFFLFTLFNSRTTFKPKAADWYFFLLAGYILLRYDTDLRPADWKPLSLLLLVVIWVVLRTFFTRYPCLRQTTLIVLVLSGCVQAAWGLLQLYGYTASRHALFSITGSFGNPGPYSGYISAVLPVAFYFVLSNRGVRHYLALAAFTLMFCVIPAGMSRSAWLGSLAACLWVIAVRNNAKQRLAGYFRQHRKRLAGFGVAAVLVLAAGCTGLFLIKKDSAYGRLFIWKNTWAAIAERPLAGYGPGAFPAVYGEKQAAYFSAGRYTPVEERVAGSPEYAFNEYLELALEGGVVFLALFLLGMGYGLYRGIRNRAYGACAGLISLLIFAFSAYPFQLIPFRVVGISLLAICISGIVPEAISREEESIRPARLRSRLSAIGLAAFLLAVTVTVRYRSKSVDSAAETWNKCRLLKTSGAPEAAARGYARIYDTFLHNPLFLFEYAQCLNDGKAYDEAVRVLQRATRVCCDPMVYNVMGESYQQTGRYREADSCYRHSIRLLPGRLYPYYLRAKLYALPDCYDRFQMEEMARIVLTKTPKVQSKAVEEMRTEIRKLLQDHALDPPPAAPKESAPAAGAPPAGPEKKPAVVPHR